MKKYKFILFVILIFAFLVRVWGLTKVPPELFGDELDVGYQAYSLLKTGRDYYGQLIPSYIHSFSEWRAPLLMYATAPFVAIFGLNEWGVRLPSALFGVLSVYLIYFLVNRLFNLRGNTRDGMRNNSEIIALSSALFLAFSPWHIQYSRAAFEVSLLLLLIFGGLTSLVISFEKKYFLIISSLCSGLTFYTYSTANLFIPLFMILLFFIYMHQILKIDKKVLFISLSTFVLVITPIAYQVLFGHAGDRFLTFSVFNDGEIINEINTNRREGQNIFIEVVTHNKPVYFGKKILSNYTNAFSSQFLFSYGDITYRHSIHTGEFFWISLPLLLLGIFSLLKRSGSDKYLWLGWLMLAPIPSALTKDGAFHATRLILILPPLIVLISFGIYYLFDARLNNVLKKIILSIFSFIFLAELFLYLHQYFVHYPKQSWRWWHTGYKEALTFMKTQEGNFDLIFFNNSYEPSLIRFLFWWKYSPERFLQKFTSDKEQRNIVAGFNGFNLDGRYYFGSAKDTPGGVIKFVRSGMLYLVSQRDEVGGDWDWEKNPPENILVLKTVRNPYNEPIFYVVTSK